MLAGIPMLMSIIIIWILTVVIVMLIMFIPAKQKPGRKPMPRKRLQNNIID
jgi:hypothetical protein